MMIIISMGMIFNNVSLMYLLLSLEWFLILLLLTLLPMLTFSGSILFLIMAISSSIMGLVLFMLSLASFGQNLFLFYKNKLYKLVDFKSNKSLVFLVQTNKDKE